jgi:hypothetical protein
VRRTLPPSAEIEDQIDQLLAVGVGENPRQSLSELAKLGARLIIQRAVEDEFDAWLGRARYERRPDYQRGLRPREVRGCDERRDTSDVGISAKVTGTVTHAAKVWRRTWGHIAATT